MQKVYKDPDADLSFLQGRTVAIIGYGNQGRAQAKNIRDSGVEVIVGSIADSSAAQAKTDGFPLYSITEAIRAGDVIFLLVPDEVQRDVLETAIEDGLNSGKVLNFAHGYHLRFGSLALPPDIDVIMVAPRMIGARVRETFKNGQGVPAYLAVWQDSSGQAREVALAVAKAIGSTRAGVLETTVANETELDLFSEQAVWPVIMRVIQFAFEVLVEKGFPPEMVALELYGSGEAAEIFTQMARTGFFKQGRLHSQTSQYGTLSRGEMLLPEDVKSDMRSILARIRDGSFAAEWEKEQEQDYQVFDQLRNRALKHPLNDAEEKVRELVKAAL
jgi:ketol-acid reductoisomerase